MGLSVGALALLGINIVLTLFKNQLNFENMRIFSNHIGVNFIPFAMTLSGYSLGCSIVAMFDRVGGGVYTKAADMAADFVGKTELKLPEDDPRNPATIADNVGDNVGDVAGLGADLLESFVGAMLSAIVLASYNYVLSGKFYETAVKLILYPIAFTTVGLIACSIGIMFVVFRKLSDKPHQELNTALIISALLTGVGNFALTGILLKSESNEALVNYGFRYGPYSAFFSVGYS